MKHWTLNLDVFQMNFLAFDRLLNLYLVTLLTQINLYDAAVQKCFFSVDITEAGLKCTVAIRVCVRSLKGHCLSLAFSSINPFHSAADLDHFTY